jgi:hypothetical protein
MSYIRNANPNATNSELDAKIIRPFVKLSKEQRADLIEQYAEIVVDRMNVKQMMLWIQEDLICTYGDMSEIEFKDQVEGADGAKVYDELVENIQVETLMKENNDKSWEYAQCVDHMVDSMEATPND